MVDPASNSTVTPSVAAVGGSNHVDDSSNSATLVAMILLGAVFIVVVITLFIYRYFRRTSGPVWISKVYM